MKLYGGHGPLTATRYPWRAKSRVSFAASFAKRAFRVLRHEERGVEQQRPALRRQLAGRAPAREARLGRERLVHLRGHFAGAAGELGSPRRAAPSCAPGRPNRRHAPPAFDARRCGAAAGARSSATRTPHSRWCATRLSTASIRFRSRAMCSSARSSLVKIVNSFIGTTADAPMNASTTVSCAIAARDTQSRLDSPRLIACFAVPAQRRIGHGEPDAAIDVDEAHGPRARQAARHARSRRAPRRRYQAVDVCAARSLRHRLHAAGSFFTRRASTRAPIDPARRPRAAEAPRAEPG